MTSLSKINTFEGVLWGVQLLQNETEEASVKADESLKFFLWTILFDKRLEIVDCAEKSLAVLLNELNSVLEHWL